MLGLVLLMLAGALTPPVEPITVVVGRMGSKVDFFADPEIKRLLLRHNIRVRATRTGSIDSATSTVRDELDFVFVSGQTAAELAKDDRFVVTNRPFTTPLVLATYQQHADLLVAAGHATRDGSGLYYTLEMEDFAALYPDTTWTELSKRALANNPSAVPVEAEKLVLAQTTNVCDSYGAGAYLGLLAWVTEGRAVQDDAHADRVADRLGPMFRAQGDSLVSPADLYFSPEGPGVAPIVVMYEHQYLAKQAANVEARGGPDRTRVLLYPDAGVLTEPEFVAYTEEGRVLAELIATDPDLERRSLELGYRVLDSDDNNSEKLDAYLRDRGLSLYPFGQSATLPEPRVLTRMVQRVGSC
ncbi:hypothetical protein ACFQV2_03225 [Actinokineospora soli]|uniref:Extracellular solute-binding protein n=1 Tax=Actinokineospora soli TaxID=1048753 RepID=A0ABW2TJP3_9PSEU